MDSEYLQDEKTILLDHEGQSPSQVAVTDSPAPPRFEQLEDRMIYTARLQGALNFNIGVNPLVDAAWELLLLVVQLKASSGREPLQALNDRLSVAVTGFETRALHLGVDNGQVMSARYVLCSVIDEAVTTTAWGSRSDWSKISLLSRFHKETFGGEKFFQLLERLSRDPVKHMSILELMYLCLSMGFEGKYRVVERGVAQLETLRDALYRQIRQVRGDPPAQAMLPRSGAVIGSRLRVISAAWVCCLGLGGLLMIYSGLAWILGNERMAVMHSFQSSAPEQTRPPM
ncbi:hypothetical protein CQZ99_27120 [Pseudomonas poae]|uniref:Type IV / VI secretion system DotU domain-containing protein n=1 Tax=Pseudomonas poae TaxID=200451 RepID=A0A2S9E8A0_9PSED|nr:hypothetical protein CQZ97_26430 [Pseudomonas poae]PRC11069.1 hypothetical protein CQZ99_27120 [Pseudomonas poae]